MRSGKNMKQKILHGRRPRLRLRARIDPEPTALGLIRIGSARPAIRSKNVESAFSGRGGSVGNDSPGKRVVSAALAAMIPPSSG
jgi:hypothetical protein